MADARRTRQRDALVAALQTSSRFVSAQELHAHLRGEGIDVGLATVYRNLASMAADGLVDALRGTDGETRYRWCTTDAHHHHLVCLDCGRSVEVEAPAVEAWAAETAAGHGFTAVTHSAEVYGRCPGCTGAR